MKEKLKKLSDMTQEERDAELRAYLEDAEFLNQLDSFTFKVTRFSFNPILWISNGIRAIGRALKR